LLTYFDTCLSYFLYIGWLHEDTKRPASRRSTDWKSVSLHDACTWCLHSAGIYCHILSSSRCCNFLVSLRLLTLTAPTISPRCYLTGPSRLSAVDTTLTTMHCLWWLRSRRSKPERHERTRSSETCADSGSVSLPLQRTEAVQQRSHSRSHSLPRTPPSRLLQDDSDSSLSSILSGSIVCAVPLEDPFVTGSPSITPASYTTGFNIIWKEA
jgi:hypothetical protein